MAYNTIFYVNKYIYKSDDKHSWFLLTFIKTVHFDIMGYGIMYKCIFVTYILNMVINNNSNKGIIPVFHSQVS